MSTGTRSSARSGSLTAAQLDAFAKDGCLVLRDRLPGDVIDAIRGVFSRTVEDLATEWREEGRIQDLCSDLPFETRYAALREQMPARFPTSWRRVLVSEPVYDLWRRPEIIEPVRSILGDEVFAHGIWNGRPREPKQPVQTVDWHQDAHYYKDWSPEDGKLITCWIPLVPVDERTGCLQTVPGSHLRGLLEPTRTPTGLLTVDPEAVEGAAVSFDMEPGDILLFTDLTLHRALPNESDYVRWSIDIRFGQATPAIMSKTRLGYRCFSGSDPAEVEPFEQWAAKYEYDLPPDVEKLSDADVDAVAQKLGVSRTELEVF